MLVQAKVWRLAAVKTGVHIRRCVKVCMWEGGGGRGGFTHLMYYIWMRVLS